MDNDLNETASGAVWAPYGLDGNPFFTGALVSRPGVHQGIHLFRGVAREKEADKLVNRILNSENSVRVIEGPSGIGKTTLASFVKSKLAGRDDTAVYPDSVIVHPGQTSPERFAAEVLYATLVALRAHEKGADLKREAEGEARGRILDELMTERDRAFELSYILGVSWTRTTLLKEARERPFGDWRDALVNMQLVAESHGIGRIVVHIDNLDQATLNDPDGVGELFSNVRDLLQLPGYHFILCANEAFRQRALAGRQGVLDIIGAPIRPARLTKSEVEDLVEARYKDYALEGMKHVWPIASAEAVKLYEFFDGELRLMFEMLTQTFVEEIGPIGEAVPRTAAEILTIQRPILEELADQLPEAQLKVLAGLAQIAADGEEVRQNRLVDHLADMEQAHVSQVATSLADQRWLVKRQPNQRATFYRLSGRAKIIAKHLSDMA